MLKQWRSFRPPAGPSPPGSKDPKTLTGLVKALGLSQERVNADLMTYKGVLSKLEAAKEIMKVGRAVRRCPGG